MKNLLYIFAFIGYSVFAQEKLKPQDEKYIYQGNQELQENNFVNAEAEYRNAISENPTNSVSKYNLGNAYFKNKKTNEALARYQQAGKVAETKLGKHKAFHNMGNSFMQQKKYDNAIEAYKNALRNNPKDDESRYNLALAKKKKEEKDKEDEKNKEKNKDKDKKDNKDKKDDKNKNDKDSDKKDDKGKEDEKKDKDDKGDKDKKDKEEDDKGKEDEKKDKQKDKKQDQSDDKKEEKPQPKKGQLSPQQVQSLLEAMNNQEKKLQEKMNAKKQKGVPVKNEKDW
jgi:tetratricopeptide (TPR) repeat protein